MCGIVAILSRPGERPTPTDAAVLEALDDALSASSDESSPLASSTNASGSLAVVLDAVAGHAAAADALLRGVPGVLALADRPALTLAVEARLDQLDAFVATREALVEEGQGTSGPLETADIEETNAALVRAKDVLWALRRDRLRTAAAVSALAGRDGGRQRLGRLLRGAARAVRHRPAGGPWARLGRPPPLRLGPRTRPRRSGARPPVSPPAGEDPLYPSGAVRVAGNALSFVYKAAAEIGELGDNTAALRAAIRDDGLLHLALAAPGARLAVLGHTRWASVGIISEPNAHPVNSDEDTGDGTVDTDGPYVVAALNGDVDNHADLRARAALAIPSPITTDAKVIPALVSREARPRRPGGGLPADGQHVRRLGRHRGRQRRRPRARCCWRSGGAGRACTSVSPTTSRSWPANRTVWWRSRTATSAWTARHRPTRTSR